MRVGLDAKTSSCQDESLALLSFSSPSPLLQGWERGVDFLGQNLVVITDDMISFIAV